MIYETILPSSSSTLPSLNAFIIFVESQSWEIPKSLLHERVLKEDSLILLQASTFCQIPTPVQLTPTKIALLFLRSFHQGKAAHPDGSKQLAKSDHYWTCFSHNRRRKSPKDYEKKNRTKAGNAKIWSKMSSACSSHFHIKHQIARLGFFYSVLSGVA